MDLSNLPTNRPPSQGIGTQRSFVEYVALPRIGGDLLTAINGVIENYAETHLLSSLDVRGDNRGAYLHFSSRESEELLLAKLTAMEAQLSTLVELLQKSL